MTWLARIVGVATVVYSVVVLVRPALLAKPAGLLGPDGAVPRPVAILTRAVCARDAAIGLAMVLAPAGAGLIVALLARLASDLSDAALFGAGAPDSRTRNKVLAVTVGWGLLSAVALYLAALD